MTPIEHVEAWLADQQAERRPGLSPSRVHACPRQSAFLLHGTPTSDEPDQGAAQVGTLLHHAWADILATRPDTLVEVPLALAGWEGPTGQHGTCDWLTLDGTTATVGDLKTKGRKAYNMWLKNGPDSETWDQLHIYAAAADHADTTGDERTWLVEIVAMCRDTGRRTSWTINADLDRGRRLADQLRTHQSLILSEPPEHTVRTGTGSGFPCDWCAWQTRCWA